MFEYSPRGYMPNHPYIFNPNMYKPPETHRYSWGLSQGIEEGQNTMLMLMLTPIVLIGVIILALISIKIAQKKAGSNKGDGGEK